MAALQTKCHGGGEQSLVCLVFVENSIWLQEVWEYCVKEAVPPSDKYIYIFKLLGLTQLLGMCRYDRSLWHTEISSVPAQARTPSTACSTGAEKQAEQHAISRSALQSLKERMATVLDVELSSAR